MRVDDAQGTRYYFCHMASRAVSVGKKVKVGDKLGVMGNTGYSFGAHTHFEMRNANNTKKLNPAEFLGIPNELGTYTLPVKNGWVKDGNDWYYYSDGEMYKNRWLKDTDGYWYRLGANGAMLTGIQRINGSLYMLNPERADNVPTGACIITDSSGAIQT